MVGWVGGGRPGGGFNKFDERKCEKSRVSAENVVLLIDVSVLSVDDVEIKIFYL